MTTLGELLRQYRKYPDILVTEHDGQRCSWDILTALRTDVTYPACIDSLDLDQEVTWVQAGPLVHILIVIEGIPLQNTAYTLSNVPQEAWEHFLTSDTQQGELETEQKS